MPEFILLFRRDNKDETISPEQMQELGKKWGTWRSELEAKNEIAAVGNRLSRAGRVVKSKDVVTDGPYAEIKEVLNGYLIVNAIDFDEAVDVAKGCPILQMGGNVEVRKFIAADDNES